MKRVPDFPPGCDPHRLVRTGSMNSGPAIRAARSDDLNALGELGALLVAEHHEFDPLRFVAPQPETASAYGHFLVSQIDRPDKLLLVAERAGSVVGYAFAGVEGFDYMALRGPAGVLYDLVIGPHDRRKGIGSALLEAVFKSLSERGMPRVILSTAERNSGAQAMFAAAGFRRTMIEMTRELASDRSS